MLILQLIMRTAGTYDIADYSGAAQNIIVTVNGSTLILTDANTNGVIDGSENDDILTNVEILKTGAGDDIYVIQSVTGIKYS